MQDLDGAPFRLRQMENLVLEVSNQTFAGIDLRHARRALTYEGVQLILTGLG